MMKWFKIRKPKSLEEQFLGKTLTCYFEFEDAKARRNPEKLKVEHIAGNLRHQTMFQINGSHLVSMLDAYHELASLPLVDQETHEQFLDTVLEHIEPDQKPKPTLIEKGPKYE